MDSFYSIYKWFKVHSTFATKQEKLMEIYAQTTVEIHPLYI